LSRKVVRKDNAAVAGQVDFELSEGWLGLLGPFRGAK
jgi:hypothetical protein